MGENTLRENVEQIKQIDVHQMIIKDIVEPGIRGAVSDLFANVLDTIAECGKDIVCTLLGTGEVISISGRKTDYRSRSNRRRNSNIKTRRSVDRIPIQSKADCLDVLDDLRYIMKRRGEVTIADYYGCFKDHPSDFTDERYGWKSLDKVTIQRARDGYILGLPPVEEL